MAAAGVILGIAGTYGVKFLMAHFFPMQHFEVTSLWVFRGAASPLPARSPGRSIPRGWPPAKIPSKRSPTNSWVIVRTDALNVATGETRGTKRTKNAGPHQKSGCPRSLAFGDRGRHELFASEKRASAAPQVPNPRRPWRGDVNSLYREPGPSSTIARSGEAQ